MGFARVNGQVDAFENFFRLSGLIGWANLGGEVANFKSAHSVPFEEYG